MKDKITAIVERVELFSPSPVWLIHYRSGNVCGVLSTDSDKLAGTARRLLGSKAVFWMSGKGVSRRLVRIATSANGAARQAVTSLLDLVTVS